MAILAVQTTNRRSVGKRCPANLVGSIHTAFGFVFLSFLQSDRHVLQKLRFLLELGAAAAVSVAEVALRQLIVLLSTFILIRQHATKGSLPGCPGCDHRKDDFTLWHVVTLIG